MGEHSDIVSSVWALAGASCELRVFRNANTESVEAENLTVLPLSRSSEDFGADELAQENLARVLDLTGISIRGGEGRRLLEEFVGHAVWVDNLDTEMASLARELGFAQVANCPNLHWLSDLILVAERWAARDCGQAARVALANLELHTLTIQPAARAADVAQVLGDFGLEELFRLRQASLDRSEPEPYRRLAACAEARGNAAAVADYLRETQRAGGTLGPQERERLTRIHAESTRTTLPRGSRILVVTNLFPPQEMGGYGRKMWEFANELARRGHEVRVLAGDAPYLWKEPTGDEAALEGRVFRQLELFGGWGAGGISIESDPEEIRRIVTGNRAKALEFLDTFEPDYCLMGNLDLIGFQFIEDMARRGVPVTHCLGNLHPGWPKEYPIDWDKYVAAPASRFLGDKLESEGYALRRREVVYPGARIDRFYRLVLPARDIPRIAFAGLLSPYKGAHTLVEALQALKAGGLEFRATIAGDSSQPSYVGRLKQAVAAAGMQDWVTFPGFLDRAQMARLFCRSNVLVFPSVFEEPFGISQVEAMAAGLTVITSGRGGSTEIVRDRIDGLVFRVEDAADLARRIAELVADPELWARLAAAGRERALEFSIPASVDTIERVFAERKAAGSLK